MRLVSIVNKGHVIVKYVRDNGVKQRIEVRNFRPYFYVRDESGSYKSLFGDKLRKIVVENPSDVPEIRERYGHFEADIPYTRRYLIDNGYENDGERLRKFYLDIEIEVGNEFPDVKRADKAITSVCIFDDWTEKYTLFSVGKREKIRDGDIYYVSTETEREMLELISKFFSRLQPDLIIAWNVWFDTTYLRNRMKRLNIPFDTDSYDEFDLLEAYANLFNPPSNALREVAFREGMISDRHAKYVDDVEEMKKKNLEDVRLIVELDKKYQLSDFFLSIKDLSHVEKANKALSNSIVIDTMLLRLAKNRGVVLPSIHEVEVKPLKGADVFKPKVGLHRDVALFDISACYPNIIIMFNISPETKGGEIKLSNGISFKKEPLGIIPELCLNLLNERYKIEDEMKKYAPESEEYGVLERKRNIIKYLVNAVYGYTTKHKHGASRLYDHDVASSITHMAREFLNMIRDEIENLGYEVIYGDTDGIFLRCPFNEAESLNRDINERIREYVESKYGVKNRINLAFSEFYKTIFFKDAAKRYAARVVWKKGKECDFIKIVGFDAVRTDQMEFARRLQQKVLEMIVMEREVREIKEFVNSELSRITEIPISDLAINKRLNKDLSEYKSNTDYVRGAIFANKYFGKNFGKGSRVRMLHVFEVNGIETDVVCFDDETDLKDVKINYEKHRELAEKKVKDILNILGRESLSRWF